MPTLTTDVRAHRRRAPEVVLLPPPDLPLVQVPAPPLAQRAEGAGGTEGGAAQGFLQRQKGQSMFRAFYVFATDVSLSIIARCNDESRSGF